MCATKQSTNSESVNNTSISCLKLLASDPDIPFDAGVLPTHICMHTLLEALLKLQFILVMSQILQYQITRIIGLISNQRFCQICY